MMNFPKRKPQYNPEAFDVNNIPDDLDIEKELHSLVQQNIVAYAPPATAEDVDKLTAEAVMSRYESAAKNIEDMRQQMQQLSDGHQKALADLAAAMKLIDETATRFRTVGQAKFDSMQGTAATIAEVVRLCGAFTAKIDPPA